VQALLKTDMSAGHFAASNRYFHMKERSIEVTPPIQPGN
jgi:protease II